jgi:VanZ family protein
MLMQLRPRAFMMLVVFFSTMVMIGMIPGEATALSARFGDKPLHVVAYAVITVLANKSLAGSRHARAITSVVLVGLLGLIDESIQHSLPYRNASLLDWCFDIGAAIAVSGFYWLRGSATHDHTRPETSHEKKNPQGCLSRGWTRHTLFTRYQGESERDAARGGQTTDSIRR